MIVSSKECDGSKQKQAKEVICCLDKSAGDRAREGAKNSAVTMALPEESTS